MKRHLMLIAGEASGDLLGAGLMEALAGYQFSGIGGQAMVEAGLEEIIPLERIASSGFMDVLKRAPSLLWHVRKTANRVIEEKPDGLVIIDSYDFTHRVARAVFRRAPEIPIINYVPPKAWSWRKGRAKAMRKYIRRCLVLFPFEIEALAELGGPEAVYVGHSALERIASAEQALAFRKAYGRTEGRLILIALGSRPMEIKHLAKIFRQTLSQLAKALPDSVFIMPVASTVYDLVQQEIADWEIKPKLIIGEAEKQIAFRAADIALAVSGTVTLELALSETPFICAYGFGYLEEWVFLMLNRFGLLNLDMISLPNLILRRKLFPEFLGIHLGTGKKTKRVTAQNLTEAVLTLLSQDKKADFAELKKRLSIPKSSSAIAAQAVLEIIAH